MSERYIKKAGIILCGLLFSFLLSCTAFAAGNVKIQSISAGETDVTLTWRKVSGAKSYSIYQWEEGIANKVGQAKASATSFTVKGLELDKEYSFYVAAVDKNGEETKSSTVSAKTHVMGLEKVTGLIVGNKDKKVKLRWKKVPRADGYVIYRRKENGEYKRLKRTKKLTCYVRRLTNGNEYSFKVSTYRILNGQYVTGELSDAVTGRPFNTSRIKKIHPYYKKGVMKETYRAGGVTFKAGTTVTIVSESGGKSKVKKGSKTYTVPSSMIKLTGYSTNYKKYYSRKLGEQFVNYKGFTSRTPYFLWVSTYGQHVYVFEGSRYNWKLVQCYICSTGMFHNEEGNPSPTPSGKGVTGGKREVWYWYADQIAYYCVDMKPGGFFHSWLYRPDGSKYPGIGRMGVPSSHGCVRLEKKDCKWIFDHIPEGTSYIVY